MKLLRWMSEARCPFWIWHVLVCKGCLMRKAQFGSGMSHFAEDVSSEMPIFDLAFPSLQRLSHARCPFRTWHAPVCRGCLRRDAHFGSGMPQLARAVSGEMPILDMARPREKRLHVRNCCHNFCALVLCYTVYVHECYVSLCSY